MFDQHVKDYRRQSMAIDPLTAGVISSGVINGASTIGNGIVGLINNKYNKEQNEWNKKFAREQFDYQKQLNQILMDREDNAVQRRAADMQAAGISKNLAAGSPAQASVMSSGSSGAVAEQKQAMAFEKANFVMEMAQAKAVNADADLKKVQAIVEAKRGGLVDEQIATERVNQIIGRATAYKTTQEGKSIEYNRELSEKYGIRINDILDTKYNTLKAMLTEGAREEGLIGSSLKSFDDFSNAVLKSDKALSKLQNNIYRKVVKDSNHWLRRYIDFSEKPTQEQINILIDIVLGKNKK